MRDYSAIGIEINTSRQAGNIKVHCPHCHDQRKSKADKSLSVNLATGQYNCHYCGWSGVVKDDSEVWMRQQMPVRRKEYKKPNAMGGAINEKAAVYFMGRGISLGTVNDMRITYGLEPMPQNDNRPTSTIQFNYFLNGEHVNTKYRTGDKKFKLVSGAELLPYNIDAIKGQKECIITEGEMDALSFYEIGLHNVVSVPNGANANLSYLDDYFDEYFDDKETIYIASDTDTKGVVLREELLRRFGSERCKIVTYGEYKDANEVLQNKGKEALLECYRNAQEVKQEGVFTIHDFSDSLDVLYQKGMQQGVTIGHEFFDKLCSFETKRLCIVTGIPGSGKSEFIDEIAECLNRRYGWKFAYFSPENAPLSYHASKIISKITGKPFGRDTLPILEYNQAKEYVEDNFFFISPSTDYKVDTILSCARYLVRRRGIKCLVIDPYNRLESEQGSRQSETLYISTLLDKLTNFAQQNDVMVILMAHPAKQPKNSNGGYDAPTLYDISGSANFYNKADFGLSVHRNREGGYTEVHVLKVKFRHLGTTGMTRFCYNINNGRYSEYRDGLTPFWDNTNHLKEEIRKNYEDQGEGVELEFDNGEEAPF